MIDSAQHARGCGPSALNGLVSHGLLIFLRYMVVVALSSFWAGWYAQFSDEAWHAPTVGLLKKVSLCSIVTVIAPGSVKQIVLGLVFVTPVQRGLAKNTFHTIPPRACSTFSLCSPSRSSLKFSGAFASRTQAAHVVPFDRPAVPFAHGALHGHVQQRRACALYGGRTRE